MDSILRVAQKYNLIVVEDAAQAILSEYKGRKLGSIGHLACLSFHETKNIQSGEGGALLINDINFIERAEIIREKGTNRSQFFRGQVDKYTWYDVGSSFLPSEITAAFLWAQLEKCEEEQNQLKQEEKQIELRKYKETCFDDSKFINIKFKTHGKSMYRCYVTAYKYTQYFETAKKCGFGLTIHGERGSGKTYLTACIANELLDKNYSVYMTSLSNLFNLMSKNYGEFKQDILNKIETVDLLIIDDVGTERNSPTDMSLMFEIFNKRDVSGKPLIITTNLKLDEFTKNSNQDYRRAYERILSKTTNVLSDMPNMRLSLAEDAKTQFNKFLKGE